MLIVAPDFPSPVITHGEKKLKRLENFQYFSLSFKLLVTPASLIRNEILIYDAGEFRVKSREIMKVKKLKDAIEQHCCQANLCEIP